MGAERPTDLGPVRRQWKRLERRVDRWLEGGDGRAILLLAALALGVAVFSAILFLVLHARLSGAERPLSEPVQGFWEALVRTIDPGQISYDEGSGRIVGLFTTIVGLLLLSTLISLVGNLVERRVERSRRGRDPMEFRRGHDDVPYHVVLGWSDLTLPLLSQLAHSHTKDLKPDVLVLADRPAAEMRQEITEYFARSDPNDPNHQQRPPDRPKHWPELRTGDPTNGGDLIDIARLASATSAIVLAPEPDGGPLRATEGFDDLCPASAEVVKTVIAVSAAAGEVGVTGEKRAEGPLRLVVEVPETARGGGHLADLLTRRARMEERPTGGGAPPGADQNRRSVQLLPVDVANLQTYLAARISRRRGLASVYRELLDFQGCEFHKWPRDADASGAHGSGDGRVTFGDLAVGTTSGILVGVIAGGRFEVPDWDEEVADDGLLIVLSEDDDSATVAVGNGETVARRQLPKPGSERPGKVLILGWNHRGPGLLEAMQAQSPSSITVVSPDRAEFDRTCAEFARGRSAAPGVTGAATVVHQPCPSGLQAWLDDDANAGLLECDHALVLGQDELAAAVSDAGVLLTLLKLNPGSDGRAGLPETVVAELRQRSNRRLARRRWADDLVVGDSLVACVLAQYAATPELTAVFDALIEDVHDSGYEFRVVPADGARPSGRGREALTFRDLQEWAWERGMIALGYRVGDKLQLNPGRSKEIASVGDRTVEAVVLDRHTPTGR